MPCLCGAVHRRNEAKGSAAGNEEEPEKLGSWADVEVLKDGTSWDSLQHDMPMPCPVSGGFCGGRRSDEIFPRYASPEKGGCE